jgi:RIO kinase 1
MSELPPRLRRKVERHLANYEKKSRFLKKRSEDYDVLEEVFDKPTLMTIHSLMNEGYMKVLNGVVATGKEARIYWGVRGDGEDVAAKIFLISSAEFRKRSQYIVGDPRFRRVSRKMSQLVSLWARKEYRNLEEAGRVGIPVPKPITVSRNVLLMQFIGQDGQPAPLLSEVPVNQKDYGTIKRHIVRLWQEGRLVHADLSEYNIFKHNNQLIIFDWGSAVSSSHPNAQNFLTRDITGVNRFFASRGQAVTPTEVLLKEVLGS